MLDLFSLLTIAATFFIVAVTPGSATLSNAVVAMNQGRKAGLIYGAGCLFWSLIAASGMGVILQSSIILATGTCMLAGFLAYVIYSILFSMRFLIPC